MARDAQDGRLKPGGLRELLALALPVIGARIGVMTMGLTDVIVVGRYSAVELSHQALGWAPTAVVLTTGMGLLMGVQVLTAQHLGAGRPHDTGAVLRRGLRYAGWIGLASAVIVWVGGPWVLRAVGLSPDLARGAGSVLPILAFSVPIQLLAIVFGSYLEALSRPLPGFMTMVLANLVNLGLNLWLVPGGFGVPALGARGASFATLGSRTMQLIGVAFWVLRMPDAKALGVFDPAPRDRAAEAEQRRVGYAAGASNFIEVAAFNGMSIIAGWLGASAVAGWAIVLNVAAVIFMGPLGLSAATGVLVGRAYGARDRVALLAAAKLGFGVCIAVTFAVAVAVGLWAGLVADLYTTDPALQGLVAGALALSCFFFVADGLQVVAAQALRSRGDVWPATLSHTVSYALVMWPLAWALAQPAGMGLNGMVWAVIIASLLSASLLLARFAWLARREL